MYAGVNAFRLDSALPEVRCAAPCLALAERSTKLALSCDDGRRLVEGITYHVLRDGGNGLRNLELRPQRLYLQIIALRDNNRKSGLYQREMEDWTKG